MARPVRRRSRIRSFLLVVGALLAVATGALVISSDWLAAFGAQPRGARLERVKRSPNYRDGHFQSPVPTRTTTPGTFMHTLKRQFFGDEQRTPPAPIPVVHPSPTVFATAPASGVRVTWIGHATVLVELDGHRILTDPIWSERASPSSWVGPKRFFAPPLALDDLPPLDAVVISHDHYDHLDMATIRALATSTRHASLQFVVPLGVGAHLERWGVDTARITELDWHDSTRLGTLTLTATPSRHFSGRGLLDALGTGNHALFATYVFAGDTHRAFFSGDTGLFDGFADIGRRYGPFDLTIIKVGAYGETWPDIHLDPEQAVQAHTMLGGAAMLPIHWGTFNLAFHAWSEPAERVVAAANAAGVTLVMPKPGQPVEPSAGIDDWWRSVR